MYDPKSVTAEEWDQIHKAAFSMPKKELFDDNPAKSFDSTSPNTKKKKEGWW